MTFLSAPLPSVFLKLKSVVNAYPATTGFTPAVAARIAKQNNRPRRCSWARRGRRGEILSIGIGINFPSFYELAATLDCGQTRFPPGGGSTAAVRENASGCRAVYAIGNQRLSSGITEPVAVSSKIESITGAGGGSTEIWES
jgi:hypothetical protein